MMARATTARSSASMNGGSVLGASVRVRGRIQGQGDLRVEGHVEGDVSTSGDLVIEDGGAIAGDIDAQSVTIGGSLTGDVAARGAILIRATAKVSGNLGGTEVSLEEGASFNGRIESEFDLPAELAPPRRAR